MKVNQEILNKTIEHFIFLQPHTTTQKMKGYFELESTQELHALLKDESTIKATIAKLCLMANIELDYFRMMYEVYRDGKVRSEKLKREYLEQKDKLNKSFKAAT